MEEVKNYPVIVATNTQNHTSYTNCNNEIKETNGTNNINETNEKLTTIRSRIPELNKFLVEINKIKRRIVDSTASDEDIKNINVFMGYIELYNDPEKMKGFKDYLNEKERMRLIIEEREKRRIEFEQKFRHNRFNDTSHDINGFNLFGSDDERQKIESLSSSDEEIDENLSEDEHMRDEYADMLDTAFVNLNRSILRQNMEIHRYHVTETTDKNKDRPWDAETDNETEIQQEKEEEKKKETIDGNEADDENDALADIEIVPDPTDDENDEINEINETNKTNVSNTKNTETMRKDLAHQVALSIINNNIKSIM